MATTATEPSRTASLPMLKIYRRPLDYPGKWVVRLWTVKGREPIPNAEPYRVCDSLEEARAGLEAAGWVNLGRFPDDDPVIHETWI